MDLINKVMNITRCPEKFLDGKALTYARRRNGQSFITSHSVTGIVCGYLADKDYWVYWVETRMLVHYDHVASGRLFNEARTTQLSHEHRGTESISVPAESQAAFLELNKSPSASVRKAWAPAKMGDEQYREVAQSVKTQAPLEERAPFMAEYILLRNAIEDLGFEVRAFEVNGQKRIVVIPAA
jgi:hypothetical protein